MILDAVPSKHFAFRPYAAQPSGGKNGWYVENCQGFNCLTFPEKPGAKFTTESHAKQIAAGWNK